MKKENLEKYNMVLISNRFTQLVCNIFTGAWATINGESKAVPSTELAGHLQCDTGCI